jgi:hypothetical protein
MEFKFNTIRKLPFFIALGTFVVVTSCGSYQNVGYDNDGIYSDDTYQEQVIVEQAPVTTSASDINYFKNYFAENKAQVDAITAAQDEVFTDPNSYKSDVDQRDLDSMSQDSLLYREPYGGWGQANDNVTINFIDNGWGWGGNVPLFGWGAGWGWGYPGFGWNGVRPGWGWGWGAGLGWGYPGWGWGAGWGWGYPGWGYPGWAWGHPGYDYDFYRSRFAFANGRRGSLLYNNNLNRVGSSTAAVSRRNYSANNRLYNTSNVNRRTRSTAVRTGSSRGVNTRVTRPNRTVRSNSSSSRHSRNRITRPSSRNSSSIRGSRSSSSSRSSGSMRSSGGSRSSGSVRSSGGSRSSGRGGRGRG